MRLKRLYTQYAGLKRHDQLLVLECWLDALFVKVLLRTPRRQALLRGAAVDNLREVRAADCDIQHLARVADLSFETMPASCLERALVVQRLLRRRGIDAVLQIGVRLKDDLLEAHAWLEHPALPADGQQQEFEALLLNAFDTGSAQWL